MPAANDAAPVETTICGDYHNTSLVPRSQSYVLGFEIFALIANFVSRHSSLKPMFHTASVTRLVRFLTHEKRLIDLIVSFIRNAHRDAILSNASHAK